MESETSITYEYGRNLYINLTNQCPNSCDFCLRNNSSGSLYAKNLWYREKEPAKEEIWEELQKKDLNSYNEIVFCGYGEPACRWDDMMWLCDRIKEHGSHFIRINTNGLGNLVNGRDIAPDFKGLIDTISISLNTPNADRYHELVRSRFGDQSFQAMLDFAKECTHYVPNVVMTTVDTTLTKEEEAQCKAICDSLGVTYRIRPWES